MPRGIRHLMDSPSLSGHGCWTLKILITSIQSIENTWPVNRNHMLQITTMWTLRSLQKIILNFVGTYIWFAVGMVAYWWIYRWEILLFLHAVSLRVIETAWLKFHFGHMIAAAWSCDLWENVGNVNGDPC